MKPIKPLILLLCLSVLGTAAHAQLTPSMSVMVSSTTTQTSSSSATSGTSVTSETLPAAWLAEAQSDKNAEIIGKGMVGSSLSRIGTDIVAKGDIDGPVSLVSGNLYILGRVNGAISVIGGDATILGTVSGPVSVVGGNIRISGTINGSASTVGGRIERTPGASIVGETSTVGGSLNMFGPHFVHDWKFNHNGKPTHALFWWRALMLVWWIGASALAVLIMPRPLENAARQLGAEPARTGAIGLLFWVVYLFILLMSVLLCFFIIGFPMLGLLVLGWLAVKWFGMTVVFLWFGRGLFQRLGWTATSDFLPVFAGAVVLGLLRMIPILGFLIWFVVDLLGAGIAILAFARSRQQPPPPQPILTGQLSAP